MRYSPNTYAEALYELGKDGVRPRDLGIKIRAALRRRGEEKKLRDIVECLTRLQGKYQGKVITVTAADIDSLVRAKKTLQKTGEVVGMTAGHFIAGVEIQMGENRVMNTITSRLDDIRAAFGISVKNIK